jgi:hypothetical protein
VELKTAPYTPPVNLKPGSAVWSGTHHVQCTRPTLPARIEDIVNQICWFACDKRAWRERPAGEKEYVVEFVGVTDGFASIPQFSTRDKLRERVRRLLLTQAYNNNVNVKIGIGRTEKICLQACGTVVFDDKRTYVDGEILSADGAFIANTAARSKGTYFRTSMIQHIALA